MKLTRLLAPLLLGAALLAACTGGAPAVVETPQGTAIPAIPTEIVVAPTPFDAPLLPPAAALAAQKALATQLGVGVEEIIIARIEQVQWNDSCLGLGGPAESCLQVITPGFRVVLVHGDTGYTFHTNDDGSVLRQGEEVPVQSTGGQEQVVQAVAVALAAKLGVAVDSLKLQKFEQQDWSDSCLGFGRPDESCAQVITPGYLIEFLASGKVYTIHTNLTGTAARMQDGTDLLIPQAGALTGVVFTFETGGQLCREIQASLTSLQTGPCGGPFESAAWPVPQRVQELEVMLQAYSGFEVKSPAGSVTVEGQGGRMPSEAEQRALVLWGNNLNKEIAAGKHDTDAGQVVRYHRSGGVAGLCEDVIVFETGFAWNISCKNNTPGITAVVRLNADQFETLSGWQQDLQSFELEHEDDASADGMTTRLVFTGEGESQAARSDMDAMITLAAVLFRTAGQL